MLIALVLVLIGATTTVHASSSYDKPKLYKEISRYCNPFCIPCISLDCFNVFRGPDSDPHTCIVPRSQYNEKVEELFYPNNPWEGSQDCNIYRHSKLIRCGCNKCTCISITAPSLLLMACATCAVGCIGCSVDPACQSECRHPTLADCLGLASPNPTLADSLCIATGALSSCSGICLYGTLCGLFGDERFEKALRMPDVRQPEPETPQLPHHSDTDENLDL